MSPYTTNHIHRPCHTHYSYHTNTSLYHTCPMNLPPHTYHIHTTFTLHHTAHTPSHTTQAHRLFILAHTLFTPNTHSTVSHTPCSHCTLTNTPLCTIHIQPLPNPPCYIYMLHITCRSSHIFTDYHHMHTNILHYTTC